MGLDSKEQLRRVSQQSCQAKSVAERVSRSKAQAIFAHVFGAYKLAAEKLKVPLSSLWPKDLAHLHEFLQKQKNRAAFLSWSPAIKISFYLFRFPAYRQRLKDLIEETRRLELSEVDELVPESS